MILLYPRIRRTYDDAFRPVELEQPPAHAAVAAAKPVDIRPARLTLSHGLLPIVNCRQHYRGEDLSMMACTTRLAAHPSQSSGIVCLALDSSAADNAAASIASRVLGTSLFVPHEIVIGRSVFGLTVRQGTPK
jgi:hypothetical protein